MNPEPPLSPPPPPAVPLTKSEIARRSPRIQRSAHWFWWIAGLSLINSLATHTGTEMHFVVGLGFTELADALFRKVQVVAYVVDVAAVAFFAGIGYFARAGRLWAFVVGGIFYLLDALIYLLFQEWMPVAFHAYALYSIYQGIAQLRAMNAALVFEPAS